MRQLTFVLLILAALISCQPKAEKTTTIYSADWKSLASHNEAPEWFADAKFGIYFHWGVYSVPAFVGEWYPRFMHCDWRDEYKHHVAQYGHPSEFGYHDFVPMFKAEHFNAKEWVDLFVEAGAKFAGPVAEHHDGFAMWDSEITPWNAMDKGPKRDVVGELAKEIKANNLKLITTFHHARNLQKHDTIRAGSRKEPYHQSHYPYFEGMPPTSDDPELKYLYGNIEKEQWYKEVWLGKLKEVIDLYQPDIIWFDSWMEKIPVEYRQQFAAYYLNEAEKWNAEVMMVTKHGEIPDSVGIIDLEKSRKKQIEKKVWMTDETISTGSWCYTEGLQLKTTKDLIHILVDVVSKNGVMLFNISPMADGTIPADQQKTLKEMGRWLKTYGEAIYGTRPWDVYGEGPTTQPEGSFANAEKFSKVKYSPKDIRFTKRGEKVYAIVLGVPEGNIIQISTLKGKTIKNVKQLASSDFVKWEMTANGLSISTNGLTMNEFANVFELDFE